MLVVMSVSIGVSYNSLEDIILLLSAVKNENLMDFFLSQLITSLFSYNN